MDQASVRRNGLVRTYLYTYQPSHVEKKNTVLRSPTVAVPNKSPQIKSGRCELPSCELITSPYPCYSHRLFLDTRRCFLPARRTHILLPAEHCFPAALLLEVEAAVPTHRPTRLQEEEEGCQRWEVAAETSHGALAVVDLYYSYLRRR